MGFDMPDLTTCFCVQMLSSTVALPLTNYNSTRTGTITMKLK